VIAIIIIGTIGVATAQLPADCACGGTCTAAGCAIGNDIDCTHGYSYGADGGTNFACACPGYSTTGGFGFVDGGARYTPFADCGAFGTAVGNN
ncbi:unnamed protein product, partial [Rotaria socialis]